MPKKAKPEISLADARKTIEADNRRRVADAVREINAILKKRNVALTAMATLQPVEAGLFKIVTGIGLRDGYNELKIRQ